MSDAPNVFDFLSKPKANKSKMASISALFQTTPQTNTNTSILNGGNTVNNGNMHTPSGVRVKTEPSASTPLLSVPPVKMMDDDCEVTVTDDSLNVHVSNSKKLKEIDDFLTFSTTEFKTVKFTFECPEQLRSMPTEKFHFNKANVEQDKEFASFRQGCLASNQHHFFPEGFSVESEKPYKSYDFDGGDLSNAMADRVAYLCDRLRATVHDLLPSTSASIPIVPIGAVSLTPAIFIGRVTCDVEDRLVPGTIMLEGDRAQGCCRVSLRISNAANLPLAPGMVVAVEGFTGPDGNYIDVLRGVSCGGTEGCFGGGVPFIPNVEKRQHLNSTIGHNQNVHLITAAGPFHHFCESSQSLSFFPLVQVLEEALQCKPHVLTLLGPFVSSTSIVLQTSILVGPNKNAFGDNSLDFLTTFWDMLVPLIESYAERMPRTRIILVPHPDDAHHSPLIPQPPFQRPTFLTKNETSCSNVMFASNPATVNIGDVSLYVSSCEAPKVQTFYFHNSEALNNQRPKEALFQFFAQRSLFWVEPCMTSMDPLKSVRVPEETQVIICSTNQIFPGQVDIGTDKSVLLLGAAANMSKSLLVHSFLKHKEKEQMTLTQRFKSFVKPLMPTANALEMVKEIKMEPSTTVVGDDLTKNNHSMPVVKNELLMDPVKRRSSVHG